MNSRNHESMGKKYVEEEDEDAYEGKDVYDDEGSESPLLGPSEEEGRSRKHWDMRKRTCASTGTCASRCEV